MIKDRNTDFKHKTPRKNLTVLFKSRIAAVLQMTC